MEITTRPFRGSRVKPRTARSPERRAALARARNGAALRSVTEPAGRAAGEAFAVCASALYRVRLSAAAAFSAPAHALGSARHAAAEICAGAGARIKTSKPMTLGRLYGIPIFAVVFLLFFSSIFYGIGLEVSIDGESLGYISDQGQFESALRHVSERASELLGKPYVISPNVSYRFTLVDKSRVFKNDEVERMLFSRIPDLKYMYVLSVGGKQLGGHLTRSVIEDALNAKLAGFSSYESAEFKDEISVAWQLAPASIETGESEMTELALSVLRPERRVAIPRDFSGGVAEAARFYGMDKETLLSLNPGITDENLPGRTVTLNPDAPLLSVNSVGTEIYDQSVPFDTEYVEDASMYTGNAKTLTDGADGFNRFTARVNFTDGRETSREITSVTVLSAPVTKVVAIGTTEPPTFIRPFYGKMTSGFKMRFLFGVTRMHTGLDFAGPTGSPVVASCAGTVIFADRNGDYGNCVIIDHGHGITTLYGHNSSISVEVGQKVKQGEIIAKLGSTGRSTGPHCHFEIRINDKPVDPMKYLS